MNNSIFAVINFFISMLFLEVVTGDPTIVKADRYGDFSLDLVNLLVTGLISITVPLGLAYIKAKYTKTK